MEGFIENGYYKVYFGSFIFREILGRVKEKNDKRWEWWRWSSKYHKNWRTGQGVEKTREEAEKQVLNGWE